MPLQLRTKDITLSESNKAHLDSVIESFKKYNLDITKIYVNITKEKKEVHVEFEIDVAHASPIVINQTDKDLTVAIDLAAERAEKALRRLHDKLVTPDHETIRTMEIDE
ncbi:MAG: ribosome-associated translation inhibitor RaiA [Epsilonproteobacteria bacterium]|nr:ribosome-associated translation inhibitor RaiA [Campylobacterota bacterium]